MLLESQSKGDQQPAINASQCIIREDNQISRSSEMEKHVEKQKPALFVWKVLVVCFVACAMLIMFEAGRASESNPARMPLIM